MAGLGLQWIVKRFQVVACAAGPLGSVKQYGLELARCLLRRPAVLSVVLGVSVRAIGRLHHLRLESDMLWLVAAALRRSFLQLGCKAPCRSVFVALTLRLHELVRGPSRASGILSRWPVPTALVLGRHGFRCEPARSRLAISSLPLPLRRRSGRLDGLRCEPPGGWLRILFWRCRARTPGRPLDCLDWFRRKPPRWGGRRHDVYLRSTGSSPDIVVHRSVHAPK